MMLINQSNFSLPPYDFIVKYLKILQCNSHFKHKDEFPLRRKYEMSTEAIISDTTSNDSCINVTIDYS